MKEHVVGRIRAFNRWLAIRITAGVGTMACAYLFTLLSLTSLPSTLALHSVNADVQWVAQTFLQLVLLSVILVGQNISSAKQDATAESLTALHDKHDTLLASHGHLNRRIHALLELDPEHHEPPTE